MGVGNDADYRCRGPGVGWSGIDCPLGWPTAVHRPADRRPRRRGRRRTPARPTPRRSRRLAYRRTDSEVRDRDRSVAAERLRGPDRLPGDALRRAARRGWRRTGTPVRRSGIDSRGRRGVPGRRAAAGGTCRRPATRPIRPPVRSWSQRLVGSRPWLDWSGFAGSAPSSTTRWTPWSALWSPARWCRGRTVAPGRRCGRTGRRGGLDPPAGRRLPARSGRLNAACGQLPLSLTRPAYPPPHDICETTDQGSTVGRRGGGRRSASCWRGARRRCPVLSRR